MWTIIFGAIKFELNQIEFTLKDINSRDINGDTPLHHAVMANSVESLSLLIESGADSSLLNNEMNGPIHVAVILNRVDILKVYFAVIQL